MFAARARRRPLLSTAWLLCTLLLLGSIATFFRGVGCYGSTRQVLFIGGGILIQGVPPGNTLTGVHSFDVDMPNRGFAARAYGFFRFPQRIGSAFWIPIGGLSALIGPLLTMRLLREDPAPEAEHVKSS